MLFGRVILIFSLFLFACSPYRGNPNLSLARDFIDAYYVMADQQKALALTTGQATEIIENEILLLKNVVNRAEAYRSRDVEFALKKEMTSPGEVIYFYELTLNIPNWGERKEAITLILDTEKNKIRFFGTSR
jgi:hypothetical protein